MIGPLHLALSLLTGLCQSPKRPTQSRRPQATGEPRWSLLYARKVISRLRLLVSELVCTSSDCRGRLVLLQGRLVRGLPESRVPSVTHMQALVLPLEGMHLRYDTVRVERASDGFKARDP